MSLLVEYDVKEGKATEQVDALQAFVSALQAIADGGYHYTAFETDDPTRFIALFEFDDDAAKQRFLVSTAFADYRDGAKGRFASPPNTTPLRLVASTRT